ncbi:DUF4829 domain-containing protein [Kineococcus sp. NBC_00420]|uniref:hypothetical protein n=1 Tax=Kineococcus sp. NBC_00420 TaxID=2903564 RepID=UPI002E24706D
MFTWSSVGLTLAFAVAVAGCGSPGQARADVVQQHTASEVPDDVVRAYLDAVQHEDEDGAAQVSTPGFAAQDQWQHGVDPGLKDVDVSSEVAPHDTTSSPDELKAYEQVVSVQVTFTVTDPDQGFSTGEPSGWGYVLVRHSDQEPWLIAEAGNG